MTPLSVCSEVREALEGDAPVVALESTLISHGLPRPGNLRVAREAEESVQQEGAVPATIGVVGGVAKIGLDASELELIAASGDVSKLSARDVPVAVAKGVHGATTVAATAHLAALAGIKLLATGGLGGVHRGARESWDISADLAALAKTPVAVVCSGVKSVLDPRATLEYLETLGVPVVGFGTGRFAGFYLTDSGCELDWSVESEREVARLIRTLPELGFESSGLLVSNPLPENRQLDPDLHDRALAAGLRELDVSKGSGKDVTPFLLARFRRETGGESLRVNEEIILQNARLAARIAVALSASEES